jgi:anti-sigma factor RsiW
VRRILFLGVMMASVACSGRETSTPSRYDAGPPPRRVISAPPRLVRALPPFAIGVEGVGPYKLGTSMSQILSTLPSGPRMALLQIPGVIDYTVVRDEGLLVGGERQGEATFIAVVRQNIARAEGDIGVSSTTVAAENALGPALMSPSVARDPLLWVGTKLPNARFVMGAGRVIGVLLTGAASPAAAASAQVSADGDAGVAVPRCDRTATAQDFAGAATGITFAPACLGGGDGVGATGELVVVATKAAGDARARRVAATEIRGLRWAAPVEIDRGRDEIVAVAETRNDEVRVYTVVALRLEGGKLVRVAESDVYRLDEQRAAWIGASLDELGLRLEIRVDGEELVAGGVLVHEGRNGNRELAPLLPVTIRRRGRGGEADRPRMDADGADAGLGDATANVPPDAGE